MVFSLTLLAVYFASLLAEMRPCSIGCQVSSTCLSDFDFAANMLLAPSEDSVIKLIDNNERYSEVRTQVLSH